MCLTLLSRPQTVLPTGLTHTHTHTLPPPSHKAQLRPHCLQSNAKKAHHIRILVSGGVLQSALAGASLALPARKLPFSLPPLCALSLLLLGGRALCCPTESKQTQSCSQFSIFSPLFSSVCVYTRGRKITPVWPQFGRNPMDSMDWAPNEVECKLHCVRFEQCSAVVATCSNSTAHLSDLVSVGRELSTAFCCWAAFCPFGLAPTQLHIGQLHSIPAAKDTWPHTAQDEC